MAHGYLWVRKSVWGCARDAAQIGKDAQGMVRVGKSVWVCTRGAAWVGEGMQGAAGVGKACGGHGLERVQRGSFLPPSLPSPPFLFSFLPSRQVRTALLGGTGRGIAKVS